MTGASSASDVGDTELNTPDLADAGDNQDAPVVNTEGATQDANDPAASSTADGTDPEKGSEDAKAPKTMLEAVTDALDKSDEGDAGSSSAESGEDGDAEGKKAGADPDAEKPGEGEGEKAEGDDDEDKLPPFHDHPRWKQIVAERDELKGKVDQAEEAVQATDRLAGYLTEQNLSVDEFNNLLRIGGLMKNDPQKALEALMPFVTRLQEVTGNVLPNDLRQAVDQGMLTEDYALETARARAQANITQFQSDTATQRHETEQQATAVADLGNAASDWERQWQASDPDYSKKADRVRDKIELVVRRGEVPQSAEEVRQMCEKFKGEVEAELRSLIPRPKTVTPNPTAGQGGSGQAAPAPKSLFEAMERAIGG